MIQASKWAHMERGTKPKADLAQIRRSCPNTCLGNPCIRLQNAHPEKKCEVFGPFEGDYRCECGDHALWDANLLVCRLKNPCLRTNPTPCVANNTLKCIAKDDERVVCICKRSFMGRDCSIKRNACIERVKKSQPNGHQNCQVNFGNQCNPILGTDAYTCTCRNGYMTSLDITEDNCLLHVNPCYGYAMSLNRGIISNNTDGLFAIRKRSITCLNGGKCLTSFDLSRAICVCPVTSSVGALFTGLNCEERIGQWSSWSKASPCSPADCSATRYRWRRRTCLDTKGVEETLNFTRTTLQRPVICFGTSEEVLPCAPAPHCMSLRLPGHLREEFFDYKSLYWFAGITVVQFFISLLIWLLVMPRLVPRDIYDESETDYTTSSV